MTTLLQRDILAMTRHTHLLHQAPHLAGRLLTLLVQAGQTGDAMAYVAWASLLQMADNLT
jgi:hypothetical protein